MAKACTCHSVLCGCRLLHIAAKRGVLARPECLSRHPLVFRAYLHRSSLPPSLPLLFFQTPRRDPRRCIPKHYQAAKAKEGGCFCSPALPPRPCQCPKFFCQLKSRCKELSAVIIFLFWVPKLEVAAVTLDPNTVHRRKLACARHPVEQ